MKFASPRGFSNVGIRKVILAEIDEMIAGYAFDSWEHYKALVWFREQIERRLK